MPEKHKEIDFVVTWVDGNDPAWLEQKNMYDPSALEVGRRQCFKVSRLGSSALSISWD